MKQIPPGNAIYQVCAEEEVTLVFTPFAGADPNMITISHANQPGQPGHALEPDPDSPDTPTFHFTVSQPVGGSETVVYLCSFSGDVTEDTRFELALTGSKGDTQEHKGPTVFGEDEPMEIVLSFDVRSTC